MAGNPHQLRLHRAGGDVMRPPMPYFGGKMSLADRIIALLPPHKHYIEPYAGSLSVLLAKPPAPLETANDLDHRLMTWWRVLRDQPDELIRRCALTPHSRSEYLACRADPVVPGDDVETARRVWVVISQGRGGSLRDRKTGWKQYIDPGGTTDGMTSRLRSYVNRMAVVADRLQGVSLECLPAHTLIERYGSHRDALLYIDPPYLGTSRASTDCQYRYEMRDEESHRHLADALRSCRAAVVLSGYHSPLYDELYADWDRVSLSATAGFGTPGARSRTEVLWSNRSLGEPTLLDLLGETS
jgi:DNA adenine methylase